MNIVDALVVFAVISTFLRGHQIGLVKQAGSTIGFVAGLFLSVSLGAKAHLISNDATTKVMFSMLLLFILSFGLMLLGEHIGSRLKTHIAKRKIVNFIDNYIGSIIAVATLALGLWLMTALIALLPANSIQKTIRESTTFGFIDRTLPPASQALAGLNHFIDPNNAPLVFSGREPSPEALQNLPPLSNYSAVLSVVERSVVRIQGLGCGGIVNGSGFVYENNRIVTNAHVVAGVKNPKVYDSDGTHDAKVVYFDPGNDIAVLYVENLSTKPLNLASAPMSKGQIGLVIGYPGGGAENAQVVASLDNVDALGRDIYNQSKIIRNVQILQANLIPGNSGGPVLDTQGNVVGVVFGTSTSYNNIGYALTLPQIRQNLNQATELSDPLSTGQCSEI